MYKYGDKQAILRQAKALQDYRQSAGRSYRSSRMRNHYLAGFSPSRAATSYGKTWLQRLALRIRQPLHGTASAAQGLDDLGAVHHPITPQGDV